MARRLVSAACVLVAVTALAAACRDAMVESTIEARPSPAARRTTSPASVDPLPSWHDSAARTTIVRFVTRVSHKDSPDFVPVEDRIAVFDNDGTLWVEKPVYTQLAFVFDRVKQLAPVHPEWRSKQPFAAVLTGDLERVVASGEQGLAKLVAATHANITTAEFERAVVDWIATARHPTLHRPYTELAYAPMLELIEYLQAHGFTTFIVSGGGVEFMRPWTEPLYGIRRDQVVGSRIELDYQIRDGVPVLMRRPELDFVADKAGKPVAIQQVIGRRPIAAFGNSDGDFEMLEWVTSGPGPRLGLVVHHTDAEREWAYDRESHVGRLSRALDAAPERGWVVVDMRRDWKRVFRVP